MNFLNFSPIKAQSATQTSIISDPIDGSQLYKLSIQAVVSGATITGGSVQIQVSNDEVKVGYLMSQSPTNWSNLGSPLAVTTVGTYLIAQQDVCYRSIRIVYAGTASAGGVIDVKLMALSV